MVNGQAWRKRLPLAAMALTVIIVTAAIVICWRHSTTVVLGVRHAERNNAVSCEPPQIHGIDNVDLIVNSAMQSQRAQALAHVCENAGITAIYASDFCRTQKTVGPLAERLGITTNVVSQHAVDGTPNVDDLIAQINTNHTNQVVLIAGHSETAPLIVEKPGGGEIPAIAGNEFDNLFVVTITRRWFFSSHAKVVRLKYGDSS